MQPKREPKEPRPKKPHVERPAAYDDYVPSDDDDDPLAMEDDAADEDFDLAEEVGYVVYCTIPYCTVLLLYCIVWDLSLGFGLRVKLR
jgi:hypothetical protein